MNQLYKYDCNGNKHINSHQKINNIKKMSDWSLDKMLRILGTLKIKTSGKNSVRTHMRCCNLHDQIVKEQLRRWMNWD